jgi:hypothetical protein
MHPMQGNDPNRSYRRPRIQLRLQHRMRILRTASNHNTIGTALKNMRNQGTVGKGATKSF